MAKRQRLVPTDPDVPWTGGMLATAYDGHVSATTLKDKRVLYL